MSNVDILSRSLISNLGRCICFITLMAGLVLASCAAAPQTGSARSHSGMVFEAAEVVGYLDNPTPVVIETARRTDSPSARREESGKGQAKGNAAVGRMVSYSANVTIVAGDPAAVLRRVVEMAGRANGFVIQESGSTGTDELYRRYGGSSFNSVTVRIPSSGLDEFINGVTALADSGTYTSVSKSGRDITDQYRDDVARLTNLKRVRDRYMALLETAETVEATLAVEKELERINEQIEIITGRIKYAEESVAYSSVSIRINDVKGYVAPKKTKPGPLGWVFVGLYHGIKWFFVWN